LRRKGRDFSIKPIIRLTRLSDFSIVPIFRLSD
jgi:hypothetical protein